MEGSSKIELQVWLVGLRLSPDKQLNVTVIVLTMHTELPVVNLKNRLSVSWFIFPTNCIK